MDRAEVPHFHNEIGAARIRIGVKDFMCVGAFPPFDHPHVFLSMGEASEATCPYCATHFTFDATLGVDCDPPECAYTLEREPDFLGPQALESKLPVTAPDTPPSPKARIAPAIDLSPQGRGLVASFASEEALSTTMRQLAGDHYELASFAPTIPEHDRGESFLPKAMLIGGIVGTFGGFAMESYANIFGYPLDIGGRPEFSWPSFVPIAFEIGVLLAVFTGITGFILAAGLFALYDPIDEQRPIRRAMRDAWVVSVRSRDLSRREQALEIMRRQGAQDIEEIGA
jgi:uncharacterized Zn-finger protein